MAQAQATKDAEAIQRIRAEMEQIEPDVSFAAPNREWQALQEKKGAAQPVATEPAATKEERVVGNTTSAVGPDPNRAYSLRFRVVDLDDLIHPIPMPWRPILGSPRSCNHACATVPPATHK
jgi:hypothetical protein